MQILITVIYYIIILYCIILYRINSSSPIITIDKTFKRDIYLSRLIKSRVATFSVLQSNGSIECKISFYTHIDPLAKDPHTHTHTEATKKAERLFSVSATCELIRGTIATSNR